MNRLIMCEGCGDIVEVARVSAKYCSSACKQKAWRIKNGLQLARGEKKVQTERCTCKHCGKGFWQSGKGRKARFCSNSCRQMANVVRKVAIDNLLTRLLHMDYHMKPFYAAADAGVEHFDSAVEEMGFVYDYIARAYVLGRNGRSFAETCEMFAKE